MLQKNIAEMVGGTVGEQVDSTQVITLQLTPDEARVLYNCLDTYEAGLEETIEVATEDPSLDTYEALLDTTGTFHRFIRLVRSMREKVTREYPDGAILKR